MLKLYELGSLMETTHSHTMAWLWEAKNSKSVIMDSLYKPYKSWEKPVRCHLTQNYSEGVAVLYRFSNIF